MARIEDRHPVFVYGTLRCGQGNHGLLGGNVAAIFAAQLPGHLLYADGLPYVAECADPGAAVTGDLAVLDPSPYEAVLARLDRLEGHRADGMGLYVRAARPVRYEAAGGVWEDTLAWVYHGGRSFSYRSDLLVAGGNWLAGRAA